MKKLKDYSSQITKAIEDIAGKEVRCVLIMVDVESEEISMLSNMADEDAAIVIDEAAILMSQPAEFLEEPTIN